ncbi:hypothetical protein Nepgr_029837 [Nepenthes gracilis]|uniref:Uncharacterized protein n=1 Tax=Nepenthes gracilis TaxID=150966 RepID=A0AAD3TF48_NEPGR|nr:hypothetical protein Nepgr_029837 [Nepenthes gracilis]
MNAVKRKRCSSSDMENAVSRPLLLGLWASSCPLQGLVRRWSLSWTAGCAGDHPAVVGRFLALVATPDYSWNEDGLAACRWLREPLVLRQLISRRLASRLPACSALNALQVSVAFCQRGLFARSGSWAGLTARGPLDHPRAAESFVGLAILHGPGHGTQH